ncbi:MAG: STT3 domain-containing protein [Candidatus Nanoarchaeia archaeon]|nr:STT3 domain-containing protein [Candidatus Nanoarchaeia archaeon]MDD5358167.1 STT3 domain-containing protein [Candidatus Nanoarchaeia archaeon]MDD5589354.1 STT3 domain-containing protein [Candidatus Nanoarchaeia archaeon]
MEEIKGEIKESVSEEVEKRKKHLINFFKKKTDWVVYGILAFILSISVFIRTRPIPKLKDITTGTWTLGPDLDPFLFLRWAKYIVEHGKLFLIDTMRYVPLADICSGTACNSVSTAGEMKLLSYMIAWFSNFLNIFDKESTVTYAAIIFPVVMAVLTGIAFFLFARKIFYKEDKKTANIIALIATTFFVLVPSILPRTIAGIPEKEGVAFFFMFLAFYFFLEAFTSEKLKRGLIFAVLAGISTGLLGLIWGGAIYVYMTIAAAVLFAFLLGKVDKNKMYFLGIWIASFIIILLVFSNKYTISDIIASISTGLAILTFFILLFHFLLFKKKIFNLDTKLKKIKLPEEVISFLIVIGIFSVLASILFGISYIPNQISGIISQTVYPVTSRFGVTVAENKQPFFVSDWTGEFGPVVFNIPLFFWLFFIGSVFLFYTMINSLTKKEKIILTFGYFIFLVSLIFSKYSQSSILDGNNGLSLAVYIIGILLFLSSFGFFYYKKYKEGKFENFKEFEFSYILFFIVLTMAIIGARGAIRLIMVLGAISPIAVAFLIVKSSQKYLKEKEDVKKLLMGISVLIILIASIFTIWSYFNGDKVMAESYAPNIYTQQWQKAMAWVRENTSVDAVFAHWWDYGYWIQSIGERATVLDGGNTVGYWNHLMGRHVLTGTDEQTALDFLYAHNTTHLLIDSTDIGKYGAFSSIGSDENYDRYSWIPTVFLDEKQTKETDKEIFYVYPVGAATDEDIILEENGQEILLPRRQAAVGAIMVVEGINKEIKQPQIILVYNGKQYTKPLRYIYIDGELHDFNSGFDAGIFIFTKAEQTATGLDINEKGAALYLSRLTLHSQLARLYLFNEESDYFKLVHSEENLVNTDLERQGLDLEEFVYYSFAGLQGPIKIWEINYPSSIQLNSDYLQTEYPSQLTTTKAEEY